MDLLFKETGFGIDYKELLGFVAADINFKMIKPDIINATKEIIKIIGKYTYDEIYGHYDSGSQQDLVHATRYAIGLNAQRLYMPSADLKHSNNGRVMRSSDEEKSPFEWMLDRDNKNLEIKYYKAVDNLLDLLADNTNYQASASYKSLNNLIVHKTSDFDDFYPIESRLLLLKLIPGLRLAEYQEIYHALTQTDYELAHSDIGQLDDSLVIYIKGALIYSALAWSMSRLSVNLLPEGVQQFLTDTDATTQGKKTPQNLEHNLAEQKFKKDADFYLSKIHAYYKENQPDVILEDLPDQLKPSFNSDNKFFNS